MEELSPELQKLVKVLESKLWRMNHLYTIKDKDGEECVMKLNRAQERVLTQFSHLRKIILKSRQQGISTLYLMYNLDACIFKPGSEMGIQSYGKNESKKLARRAKLAWDKFPQEIKDLLDLRLEKYNSDELVFSNGSTLKIGNFRGDTLQSLHVSELGKIAKKFPEKAKELKAGAFQAVGKNNRITIESTAEGKSGLFYEMWLKAMRNQKILGPFDFQPIFLSWIEDPDCNIDTEYPISQEMEQYFLWVEEQTGVVLTSSQKWWYVSKEDELSDMMKQEYPTTWEEAFEQSVEGTIYRNEFTKLYKEERVKKNLAISNYPTYVSYDLGMNDRTVLTFCQVYRGVPKVIYSYSNKGEKLEFYIKMMYKIAKKLNVKITRCLLPHDAKQTESIAGRTRIEEFRRHNVPAVLVKKMSIKDGINATRQFIDVCEIDAEHCDTLLGSMQIYRWKYDQRVGVYLSTPEHDDSSNDMDSLRYMACGIHYTKTSKSHYNKTLGGDDTYKPTHTKRSEYEGFAI